MPRDRRGHRPAGLRRLGELLRRRSGRSRADDCPRRRDRAGGLLDRGLHRATEPLYDIGPAAERVAAAAEAAHAGPVPLVLTARAENYLHGRPDLADTITRLLAYQAAGADVLYAPGLTSLADIRQVVTAVDRPVNVLAMPGTPPVSELAAVGVSRVSVGGAFAFAALAALVDAATELRDKGTYGYLASSAVGRRALRVSC